MFVGSTDLAALAALRTANRATILALATLAEYRDTDTGDHVIRVGCMTHEIARTLHQTCSHAEDLTDSFCEHIAFASILHDLGKVAVPDAILKKPGRLDDHERIEMQKHSVVGADILRKALALAPDCEYLKLAVKVAHHHHERYDGMGYPNHLQGEEIPLAARIVSIADVFDALISERPYKQPWTEAEATAYLVEHAGEQFDPEVVAAALRVLEEHKLTPVFCWSQEMSVNHPVLDHDHRVLIGLVNQMALPSNRSDRTVQEFVLDELVGYTVTHFAREEAYMREIGFAGIDHHRHNHQVLIDKLMAMRASFIATPQSFGEEIWNFTANWLKCHILGDDLKYKRPDLIQVQNILFDSAGAMGVAACPGAES